MSARRVRDGAMFPSLHAENEYRVPAPTVCGDGTRSPMLLPASHQLVYGPVLGKLSTVTVRPAGVVVIVIWYWTTKFAVTVVDASHVIGWACAPASVQVLNRYWLVGETVCGLGASRAAVADALHQKEYGAVCGAPFTETVRPAGFDPTVMLNCVRKVAVYVASAETVIVRGFTADASFHWENAYRTPGPPGCGLWPSIRWDVPDGNWAVAGAGCQAPLSNLTRRFAGFVASVIVYRWKDAK